GARRRPDHAVVDVEQRHQHLDVVQRRRNEVGADRQRARRADRDRLQRQRERLRRHAERQDRRGALHLRDRGRAGPRLVADGQRHGGDPRVDRSSTGAVYKGLATLNDRLYATDFHNNRVDVFDASFAPITAAFKDASIPKGYAPFGIQAINGNVFVTYAKQDAQKKDDVPGGGAGY